MAMFCIRAWHQRRCIAYLILGAKPEIGDWDLQSRMYVFCLFSLESFRTSDLVPVGQRSRVKICDLTKAARMHMVVSRHADEELQTSCGSSDVDLHSTSYALRSFVDRFYLLDECSSNEAYRVRFMHER